MPYHEINEVVSNKLNSNRDRHEQLINKLISAPALSQILPIVQIQFSIKRLLESYRYFKHINDDAQLKEITTIANTFFYYMINTINENINSFHPAQDLCTVVLSQIGVRVLEMNFKFKIIITMKLNIIFGFHRFFFKKTKIRKE